MRQELLTYAEVDRRIEALPEGPMGAMRRPPGMLWLERLGYVGVILGLEKTGVRVDFPCNATESAVGRA